MNTDRTLILGQLGPILPPGSMREVEVQGDKKSCWSRQDDKVTAIGAECPHAGGPLAEGVLAEGKVYCPWHKAAFCTRTGAVLDPPAVDDLPAYDIEIRNGDIVLRSAEPLPPPSRPTTHDNRRFVILGAGAAGFSAAQALRKTGFTGAITLISREAETAVRPHGPQQIFPRRPGSQ